MEPTFCSLPPNHEFKGKIISRGTYKPLNDVKLSYTFYPEEIMKTWPGYAEKIDSIKYTEESGKFEISFSTLAVTFDSLKITLTKEGYHEKTLVSRYKDWRTGFGINKKDFRFNFGAVPMEKKIQ